MRLTEQTSVGRLEEVGAGLKAALHRWRWGRRPPWEGFGQPFNGQDHRRKTVDVLVERFGPKALIETGTFMCFTTRHLAAKGVDTYTVEVNPGFGWLAARELNDLPNVTLVHGNSGAAIERLGASGRLQRPLAYLDAHWEKHLPLSEEVESLFSHWDDALVVIDDFEVPGMPGYGFDVYDGVPLSLDAIAVPDGAVVAFPAVPPEQETGSRRGTVYLGQGEDAKAALEAAAGQGLITIQETVG